MGIFGTILKVVGAITIIGLIIGGLVLISGSKITTKITGGSLAITCEQKCLAARIECYDRCGEGTFSGLCKDGCTLKYNDCLTNCK